MSYVPDDDAKNILDRTENRLVEVIGEFVTLHRSGSVSSVGTCPLCGANKLEINPSKHVFKCFACNELSGKRPIDFLMKGEHMSYPDALRHLAKHVGYILPEETPKKQRPVTKKVSSKKDDCFCNRMLAASGLTVKDVMANVFRKDKEKTCLKWQTFRKGTIDSRGEIDPAGDDAIIEYFDLDGYPVSYFVLDNKKQPTDKRRNYYRVRWQFPEEHLDKSGKVGKYKTPYGGGTHVYIPQRIREAFQEGRSIDMLFIQEGEKKAEKACKHGMMSVAISGIQNLGQQGRLPEDLIRIIQGCHVKEVCFLLDADWNDISANIRINDQVEKRPRNFFYAVRNFKDYCRSLKSRQIYVEIYFAHVNKNEADDKGIDDLLANTLKGEEDTILDDLNTLLNNKNLTGKYLTLYKITSVTDHKLEEYWNLNHPAKFAEAHKDILKNLPEFRIGKHAWKFNEFGEFVSAQPLEPDEQYWEEIEKENRSGERYTVYSFNYARCFRFLQNRGFGRYRKIDGTTALIHLDPPIVKMIEATDVRDFVTDFTKSIASEAVLNMLYKGGPQYLGPDKLSNIDFLQPNFDTPTRSRQMFFFENNCWEVTKEGIQELDYTKVQIHIWANQKKTFDAKKLPSLIKITQDAETGKFSYQVTETGKKCHFLQFLINTSNFTWRKEKLRAEQMERTGNSDITIPEEDIYDNYVHLIAKMCAIGFMLLEAKDRSVSRAVVAMDGKQSEVGASNGRSGKSIVGEMFKYLMPTFFINGKVKDLPSDNFLWNDLVEGMRCCFIDDVRPNFDFEFLFANITGDWKVNYKGGSRATFNFPVSPKIYLTTNHALNGDGSSFLDRQWLIAFSDYYNNEHKPIHDFGTMFFDEWDFEQWNLHWNLMAECVRAYLMFGVVESPGERLEIRRLRQDIGETFLLWADEYYSEISRVGDRIPRKTLYDAFLDYAPEQRKYCSATVFKKKLQKYCKLRGYIFNPGRYDAISGLPMYIDSDGKPDLDDKSNGVEYFTVGQLPEVPANIQKANYQPGEQTVMDILKS